MSGIEVLTAGVGEYRLQDPDVVRAWMRDHKRRDFADKTTTAREAVSRLVADGDYVSFDFSSFTRGPLVLVREIIRQRRRNLWYSAKFTLMESTLLVTAGACTKIDVGFMGLGDTLNRAVERGDVSVSEWTNGTLTLRHLAGAMGVPFLPTRALLGTDTLRYSGAKVIQDPFTGKPIALVDSMTQAGGMWGQGILDMAERRSTGIFNATGPEDELNMEQLLEEIRQATERDARLLWLDESFLLDHAVEAWSDLPLWLAPRANPELAHFLAMDIDKALAAGLRFRPLAETIRDTLGQAKTTPDAGLDPAREAELLDAWSTRT